MTDTSLPAAKPRKEFALPQTEGRRLSAFSGSAGIAPRYARANIIFYTIFIFAALTYPPILLTLKFCAVIMLVH